MHEVNLGHEPSEDSVRDAVHVAVIPMVADVKMYTGQDVDKDGTTIGIVDPFRTSTVHPGERYWCFLLPNTVTGMRHHWMHPLFDEPDNSVDHEEFMRGFAEKADMTMSQLEERLRNWVDNDEEWVEIDGESARDAWYDLSPSDMEYFWKHAAKLWDITKPDKPSWSVPFSCSC